MEPVMSTISLPASAAHRRPSVRHVVSQFTPNWFTVTMGTGVLPLALNQFVGDIPELYGIALVLWAFNIALFALFSALTAARWIFFFGEARRIFAHPVASMFFGAIPMGLATIINGFIVFGIPLWGHLALTIAHTLWWIDVAMSAACGLLIPYFMFTRQEHSMEKMTAVWLLPVVAAEVAAASAGLLVPHLPTPEAYSVLLLGYVLWAMSVPLAMSILVILVLRLALHKLPEREMAVSGWLALGPIGTGALGLLLLGGDAPHVFATAGLPSVGDAAFGFGVIGGTVLWGYGVWWLLLAILKTRRHVLDGMPFNLGWWGFTFPLGVYSLATLALARTTHVLFFSVTGAVLVTCLGVLWAMVAARTVHGVWCGHLFPTPQLQATTAGHAAELPDHATSGCKRKSGQTLMLHHREARS
jgi:C4-dicarboxylate transporter/malic acid transport protein